MRALLTNDDGIDSAGLRALATGLAGLGWQVFVVAPDRAQDACGHAITLARAVVVRQQRLPGALQAWSVAGTPVDCVKLALERLLPHRPGLVVAGINRGSNLGSDVLYSGTVAAAREGYVLGVPSVAVSLDLSGRQDVPWAAAATASVGVLRWLARRPVAGPVNVNLPADPAGARGIRVTRLGRRRYVNEFHEVLTGPGVAAIRYQGCPVDETGDGTTDVAAVRAGLISVTPLLIDLTNVAALAELTWVEELPPVPSDSTEEEQHAQHSRR